MYPQRRNVVASGRGNKNGHIRYVGTQICLIFFYVYFLIIKFSFDWVQTCADVVVVFKSIFIPLCLDSAGRLSPAVRPRVAVFPAGRAVAAEVRQGKQLPRAGFPLPLLRHRQLHHHRPAGAATRQRGRSGLFEAFWGLVSASFSLLLLLLPQSLFNSIIVSLLEQPLGNVEGWFLVLSVL